MKILLLVFATAALVYQSRSAPLPAAEADPENVFDSVGNSLEGAAADARGWFDREARPGLEGAAEDTREWVEGAAGSVEMGWGRAREGGSRGVGRAKEGVEKGWDAVTDFFG